MTAATANPTAAVMSRRKRLCDVVIALTTLILLSPLLVVLAGLVALFLGRPIFFKQTRPGLHGRPFLLCKFRTMRDGFDATGQPLPDQVRLTRFGRWLRATSLDELPELWQVVTGDMSLVGPRPWLMEYLTHYTPEQNRRHLVRPGLTGWAQIHGRNAVSWDERIRFDVWYVDHWSFALDLCILWRTVWLLLQRRGVQAAGQATSTRFDAERGSDTAN